MTLAGRRAIPKRVKIRRVVALGPGVAAVATVLSFTNLVILAMTPGTPFDLQAAPRAPDYTDLASWSALPQGAPAAAAALPELPAGNQNTAPVNVFYVHPTSYVGSKWNGPVDDAALNALTDRVATGGRGELPSNRVPDVLCQPAAQRPGPGHRLSKRSGQATDTKLSRLRARWPARPYLPSAQAAGTMY